MADVFLSDYKIRELAKGGVVHIRVDGERISISGQRTDVCTKNHEDDNGTGRRWR